MKTAHLPSILNLLLRLRNCLSQKRQRDFVLVFILMIISSFFDVVSLGSLLPFIGILMSPDKIFTHPVVAHVANFCGIHSSQQMVIPLTLLFVAIALIAGFVRIFYAWVSNWLVFISGADISIQIYKRILNQPYKVHVSRNSSQVIHSIASNVNTVVYGVLQPLLLLCSSIILMLSILSFLLMVNFLLSIILFTCFSLVYVAIAKIVRKQLNENSRIIDREQAKVIKSLQEGLGGIRDVLLDNSQKFYCDLYHKADLKFRWAQGNNVFIGSSPKFIMEAFIMILIAVVANYLSHSNGGLATYVPLLGVMAVGAQRIFPALQLVFASWVNIISAHVALVDIVELLEQPYSNEDCHLDSLNLKFERNIQFIGAKFRYTDDDTFVINGVDLNIPKGARVGIIGSTGGGKSTMLDILMGLLVLNEGKFLVDDKPVNHSNYKLWQKNIAHVPQNIFLSDSTFAQNIAFGISEESIDMDRVKLVAVQAQIANFIESRPDGYNSFVGERGVRLSGGQRQRIGIARALYKNANVLVFDEATSALDNDTEKAVMDAIDTLNRDLTVFLVAHRLNTVCNCDMILKLENGKVVASGTYAEIVSKKI